MNIKKLEAVVEAILFSMGEAVEIERLAAAVDHDEDTVRKIIRSMMTRYDEEDRGIHLIELDGSFQLCTKPEMYEYLIKVAHIPKKHVLTDVLLETLSIVAYKLDCRSRKTGCTGKADFIWYDRRISSLLQLGITG